MTRAPRREHQAKPRRLRKDRERLEHEHRRAPRFLQALAQARVAVGLPETLGAEVEWRLQAPVKRRGNIFGLRGPTGFGCRTVSALTPGRVWEKHDPGRLLGARPQPPWSRPVPRRGQALLIPRWPPVADQSPATPSWQQGTWAADDRVGKPSGQPLELVGPWDRGPEPRGRLGIDGRLLVRVMGDGQRVVHGDVVVRRPDPGGPGRPGRDHLTWWQVLLDRPWASRQRRCRGRPPPVVVEGQRRSVCARSDGRRVPGADLRTPSDWPWRHSPQVRGLRQARLTAISATYGRVTLVRVDTPGAERVYWRCPATTLSAPRLIRAWSRRRGSEPPFRTPPHPVAAEACQVQTEDADDGHLVWRLWAGLGQLYTARCRGQGRVTLDEVVLSLNQPWRVLTSAPLE